MVAAATLIKLSYEALSRYFTRLSLVGYLPYSTVDTLLVLLYITHIRNKYELDNKLLGVIDKALNCLLQSCLLPLSNCKRSCNLLK